MQPYMSPSKPYSALLHFSLPPLFAIKWWHVYIQSCMPLSKPCSALIHDFNNMAVLA